MSVRFDSTEYEFTHGHLPRGRGTWAFEIDPSEVDLSVVEAAVEAFNAGSAVGQASLDQSFALSRKVAFLWLPPSTYSDARRRARLILRRWQQAIVVSVAT